MRAQAILGAFAASSVLVTFILTGCTSALAPDEDRPIAETAALTSAAPQPRFTSLEPWLGAVAGCLQDRGWNAQVDGTGGGIGVDDLPVEQRDAYRADSVACETEAGIAPNALPPTEDQLRAQYQHLVDSVECMRALGIEVTHSTPPSEATWLDDHRSGLPPWSPFVDLPELSQSEWDNLNRQCPQTVNGL